MHTRGSVRTALLFSAALGASDVRAQQDHAAHAPAAAHSSGLYLPEPIPLQDFTLVDHSARPFTRTDLEGNWTLVVFGYTHCPDVCPTTLAQVRDTLELLRQKGAAFDVRGVLVSIDPERDTPEQLAGYVGAFGEDIVGLTGSQGTVAAFAEQFKVKYAVTERTPSGYFVDHSSSVALLTPDAKLRALFSVPLRPAQLADDLHALATDPAHRGH